MQSFRPISRLRNKFTGNFRDVHDGSEPIIPVRNGSADMTVMSMETFHSLEFDSEVYRKLKEAERQAVETERRYTSKEALATVRQIIAKA